MRSGEKVGINESCTSYAAAARPSSRLSGVGLSLKVNRRKEEWAWGLAAAAREGKRRKMRSRIDFLLLIVVHGGEPSPSPDRTSVLWAAVVRVDPVVGGVDGDVGGGGLPAWGASGRPDSSAKVSIVPGEFFGGGGALYRETFVRTCGPFFRPAGVQHVLRR